MRLISTVETLMRSASAWRATCRAPWQLQRSRGSSAYNFALVLGHGGQDVDGQLIRVRVIDGDELDTGIH
jgi:hypothetical protein